MPKLKDLTGNRYGKWVVLRRCPVSTKGRVSWMCRCACGREEEVSGSNLACGQSKQCSKCRTQAMIHGNIKHGNANRTKHTPEYQTWCMMKSRCYNPNFPKYSIYGARGIVICDAWKDDFNAFLAYVGPRPSPRHSIERIDVNGNYEPGNVKWASPRDQARNRQRNVVVTIDGVTSLLVEACERLGLSYIRMHYNIVTRGRDPQIVADRLRSEQTNAAYTHYPKG